MSAIRYWALWARLQQQSGATGSAALVEAADAYTAAADVGIAGLAALGEGDDSDAASATVVVTGSAAPQETADQCNAHAGSGAAPGTIDPNYLVSARPRGRRLLPASRLRRVSARPRVRNIIAVKRA